ncbi:MAG TPA: GGDEF domain-containing response regulator [Opitutus sp.]|nr:GGDEF domain-containing response regulator [Opitutus sp.]
MTRKILLIDDDRMQFRLTQAHFRNFRGESFELQWAETFEAGIAKLLSGDYAACLLDYQLGPRNGLELIRQAVAAGCRTPIVFLTAESSERVDIEAMNAGALDYLVKGEISSHSLERSLRYALKLGDTLEALRQLATRDQLTGLLNRREFDRILAEETERAQRFGHSLALVMVDIDRFKAINDTHGHPIGDAVLRDVARRLAEEVRTVDRVARFGGEEFALVIMESDAEAAMAAARRASAAMEREPVWANETLPLTVTVSAGVAALPADAESAEELVRAADRALYAAKAAGRNCARSFASLAAGSKAGA